MPSEPAQSGQSAATSRAAAQFKLSPAETQLLHEIISGRTLAEAAERLGRAINTVRNQLQSIFAKTQTHRQAELVAKVLKRLT